MIRRVGALVVGLLLPSQGAAPGLGVPLSLANTPQAEVLVASWYGPRFEGKQTASGEVFDPQALTAAHRTLPFGALLLVEYAGRQVAARVTDRGPFIDGRSLDLSQGAAEALGMIEVGVAPVLVTRL